MIRYKAQKGFTLLEVMVVVFIISIMAGLSFFALNQATDRRYSSQAEDFRVWLQQVSDMAMLEGTAYGVSYEEDEFQAVVYYNYAWYRVGIPEPFHFNENMQLALVEDEANELTLITRESDERKILPDIIMLPDGYLDPDMDLALSFENFTPVFKFRQEDDGINLFLERTL